MKIHQHPPTRQPSWRTGALAAACAVLIAGCSLAPKYERPAMPMPDAWPQVPEDTRAAIPTAASDLDWHDFFTDPHLQQLVEIGLANNRDLRVAASNVELVRAQYQIQRADLLPTLALSASATRERGQTGQYGNTFAVGLGISSWEIDFFGRISSLSDAALAQYFATDEARKAARISLISSIASYWLLLQADEELVDLAQSTLTAQEESVELTKLRFDSGVSSEVDYRQALGQLESTRAALVQQQRLRMQDENALVLLLGQPIPPEIRASLNHTTRLEHAPSMPDLPVGLPSDLLMRRPDIRQAEQSLISANANIGAARAAFFPRIALTASAGLASSELSNLFSGSHTRGFSLAPQLSLPIFDAGRNRANLEVAEAQRDIAVAQYEKSIQSAFSEVADALAGLATLTEQRTALLAQINAVQRQVELSDLQYRNGIANYMNVLDARRTLFATQQSAVQVQLAELQNKVILYKVLGGGWADEQIAAATPPSSPQEAEKPATP